MKITESGVVSERTRGKCTRKSSGILDNLGANLYIVQEVIILDVQSICFFIRDISLQLGSWFYWFAEKFSHPYPAIALLKPPSSLPSPPIYDPTRPRCATRPALFQSALAIGDLLHQANYYPC